MAKFANITKLLVVKKISGVWEKDGKTGKNYKLIVLQGDNAETFSCPEDLLEVVEEYKEYSFVTEFNSDYKSFRIVGLIDNKNKERS